MGKKFEHAYIIPFLSSLEQCLSVKETYEAVIANFKSNAVEPSVISDIWDGKQIRSNPTFFQQKGAVLGIQLYFDELEVCNPLGSKKGKHKVGIFYWTLMNLRPEFRSNLRAISLLAIVGADLLKTFGYEVVLAEFLIDMKILQNGFELQGRNDKRMWFGVLLNVVGDMSASNSIGGFKEGFSKTISPCRIWEIHRFPVDAPAGTRFIMKVTVPLGIKNPIVRW